MDGISRLVCDGGISFRIAWELNETERGNGERYNHKDRNKIGIKYIAPVTMIKTTYLTKYNVPTSQDIPQLSTLHFASCNTFHFSVQNRDNRAQNESCRISHPEPVLYEIADSLICFT